jgi:hypothetical protein
MGRLTVRPLPSTDEIEAVSWFSGWWHGIAVGGVIGAALAAILIRGGLVG